MVVNCAEVWQQISNYLDGDLSAELRQAIENHVRGCKHCTAVLEGTRNVVRLYGDDRVIELPANFTQKWQQRLPLFIPSKGTAYGWLVAVAALAIVSGTFALGKATTSTVQALRSQHSEQAQKIPAAMMVEVVADGKTFHVPGCKFIHQSSDKVRLIAAADAMRAGYVPCVRCLREYLRR
jgi:anti-sigma factor RsiW